jgi:large subunit ribosomal protein L23
MNEHSIIVRPIVTELGMHMANTKNAYSFEVHSQANKIQVRHAVEKLYNVKVLDVRTANVRGKLRRRGRSFGRTRSWKKAVVVLHKDNHIDLF